MVDILIISPDVAFAKDIQRLLAQWGYCPFLTDCIGAGIAAAEARVFDIVLIDADGNESEVFNKIGEIKAAAFSPEIILLSRNGDVDTAERAITSGVWDFLQKPPAEKAVKLALSRALQYHQEKKNSKPLVNMKRGSIIGESQKIRDCLEKSARAARSNASVFFSGETGTGKELFARAIHINSARAKNNFVVVDCGSLPETLMESLLFGHAKGAFTGALRAEEGLIKHADGGTLFLDEVGELPLSMQKTFLRVLQEKKFRPLGVKTEVASDFRLVAASNRNLDQMAANGQFREDLLYRLRSVEIYLPPLRERTEDIEPLAVHYVRLLCKSLGIDFKGFSSDFFNALTQYNWPGNVRELFGALERAVAEAMHEQTLFPNHLPEKIRIKVARASLNIPRKPEAASSVEPELNAELPSWKEYRRKMIEKAEIQYLRTLMEQTGSVIQKAAQLSGLSPPRLYELLRKYHL